MPPYREEPQFQDAEVRGESAGLAFLPADRRVCVRLHRQGVAKMRAAGLLAARILDEAGALIAPGVTTDAIDALVHDATVAAGAYPSPLNYGRFPKSVCTSLNEVICHGIPDSTALREGDIINVDVTVYLDGHHGDTSRTFLVGAVDPEAAKLVEVTRQALEAGIAVCKPGAPFRAIGAAIHALADQHGYGVCAGFCGHGVGRAFHSGPTILHCRNSEPGTMVAGQTFTIEPMLTLSKQGVKARMWNDGWTAVTVDGSWSAQFEHTLLITPTGVEILTRSPAEADGTAPAARAPAVVLPTVAAPQPVARPAAPPKPAKQKRRPQGGVGGASWTLGQPPP